MLKNAVLSFYQERQYRQALRIYKELQTRYPRPEFEVSLPEFARNRFLEEFKTLDINNTREQIIGLLKESWYLYAIFSDNEAVGRQDLAKQLREYFLKEGADEEGQRINLPPMNELYYISMKDFLSDQRYPPYLKQNLQVRLYREQPELYQEFKKRMDKEGQEQQAPVKSAQP